MSTVLVTGVAGFIGQEVAIQLLKAGFRVVGIDNFNDYYDPRLKHHRLEMLRLKPNFEFFKIDIENAEGLETLFEKYNFSTVFNLAARAGVGASVANPFVYYQTNLIGTLNLLQVMVKTKVSKLVLASTSSVYSGESLPFNEEAAVNRPISPYAATKKAAEQLAYNYYYHFGVSCSVVRYFTVYGPAGRPDMSVFRFMRQIDQQKPLELFGDGRQSRDFTFVQDIARGTLAAAQLPGYEIINLGGGRRPTSILELIKIIEKNLGKQAKIDFKQAIKADVQDTRADIRKAKEKLGWQPEIDLNEGLDRTLDWYVTNRDFILGLKV